MYFHIGFPHQLKKVPADYFEIMEEKAFCLGHQASCMFNYQCMFNYR